MNEILLISSILMAVTLFIALVWVVFSYKKLKQELSILRDDVERNNKDIAGLCSAAVSVDSRLLSSSEQLKGVVEKVMDSHEQLKDIVEKVTGFERHGQQESSSQPYHSAIQRIHDGASAEELIKQCGLSRDEAVLLIRLHGKQQ